MTTLHLIRDSALSNNTITLALKNLMPDDVIVLLDDGCYNVNNDFIKEAQTIISINQCYAVEEHVLARTLPVNTATLITYKHLLELIFKHHNVITWQ